jgi:hypothetical protein
MYAGSAMTYSLPPIVNDASSTTIVTLKKGTSMAAPYFISYSSGSVTLKP